MWAVLVEKNTHGMAGERETSMRFRGPIESNKKSNGQAVLGWSERIERGEVEGEGRREEESERRLELEWDTDKEREEARDRRGMGWG